MADNNNVVEDFTETVSPSEKPRKRIRNESKWKKNVKKARLYSDEGKRGSIKCRHIDITKT